MCAFFTGLGGSHEGNVHAHAPRQYVSLFFINSGTVTGYEPDGKVKILAFTKSKWDGDEEVSFVYLLADQRGV